MLRRCLHQIHPPQQLPVLKKIRGHVFFSKPYLPPLPPKKKHPTTSTRKHQTNPISNPTKRPTDLNWAMIEETLATFHWSTGCLIVIPNKCHGWCFIIPKLTLYFNCLGNVKSSPTKNLLSFNKQPGVQPPQLTWVPTWVPQISASNESQVTELKATNELLAKAAQAPSQRHEEPIFPASVVGSLLVWWLEFGWCDGVWWFVWCVCLMGFDGLLINNQKLISWGGEFFLV